MGAAWRMSRQASAIRSSSSTATRRPPTSGATSFPTPRPRPLHRSRPHRHGRLGQAAGRGPVRYRFVEHRRYLDGLLDTADVAISHARCPRLGLGARFRLGAPPPRRGARHRLHGGPCATGDLGGVARAGATFFRPCALPLERRWCWRRTSSSSAAARGVMRGLTDEEMAAYREPFPSLANHVGPC